MEDVFREWDQSVCQTQIIRYQAPETERVEQANLPLEKEPSMYRQKGEHSFFGSSVSAFDIGVR